MQSQVELEEIDPSYNGYVVAESTALATTLDQYWLERRALCEQIVERHSIAAGNTKAEQDWLSFCSSGTGFLNRYLAKATDSIDSPLRQLWQCSFAMAREARMAFEKEASAEIWIPFSLSPVKFVRVSSAKGTYDIRETTRIDQDQAFELGKPYVALCWRDTCLCLIVPSRAYVTMSTFTFAKDERTWSTEEVVPRVFANNLADFQDSLYAVERQFAPLLKVWDGRERLSRASAQLQAIGRSAEAWRRVQIPDAQKLDTLSPASLSSSASTMIADETNVILVSAASAWEIATKVRIGKLPGAETLEKEFLDVMEDAGYTLLDINVECALRAGRLVGEHRDPFDRMIAAQALADDIPVLSADPKLDAFGVRRLW